jgi:hypothetical protein
LAGTTERDLQVLMSKLGERSFELLMAAAGDYCVRR